MSRRAALAILAALVAAPAALAQEPARFSAAVRGDGPDVILIPGLASSGAIWDATVEQLASTHRVHVIATAGFAGAPAAGNAEGPVLGPLAEALGDYAAALDRPVLVGHSLGGLAALQIAIARPEAVSRILVVDALPFYPLVFNPAATPELMTAQAGALRDQLLAQSPEQFAAGQEAGAAGLAKSDAARAQVAQWARGSDQGVVARTLYDGLTTDVRPRLGGVTAPTTVVYAWDAGMGRPAEAVDALYAGAYEGLDGARLVRIDGAFHFLMLDQPAAFAAAVSTFLE
jgi:pimeloyl-ACP methyl ester carboxylesterase